MDNELVVFDKKQIFLPIKIELKPSKEQLIKIRKFAGCARHAFNHWLWEKNQFYQDFIIPNHEMYPDFKVYCDAKRKLSDKNIKLTKDERKELKEIKKRLEPVYKYVKAEDKRIWKESYHCTSTVELKNLFPYMKECDSQAICQAYQHFDKAFKNFYEGLTNFPKFKKKKDKKDSFATCMPSKKCLNWNDFTLTYPKIGKIPFKNRKVPEWYKNRISSPKSITITALSNGKIFATVLFQVEEVQCIQKSQTISENQAIALDFDLHDMYIDSNGKSAKDNFGWKACKKESRRLKHLQRQLDRTKEKSKNHEKLRKKVSLEEWKISQRRNDWLEKESLRLVRNYQAICLEDLDISKMKQAYEKNVDNGEKTIKKHRIQSNKITDAYDEISWSKFVSLLEWKSRKYDCQIIKINRWFPSSQLCHCCGYKFPPVAKERLEEWTCPNCGEHHQRDENAARNILTEGLRILNSVPWEPREMADCGNTVPSPQSVDIGHLAELALVS